MCISGQSLLGVVLTMLAPLGGVLAATLVEDGQPRASIVLPEEPPQDLALAAQELQTYLKKSTGAELPLVEGDAEGTLILLGSALAGRVAGIDLAALDLGDDGFVIDVAGERIVIAGETSRATLYGACAFLERFLGIRWYWPGEVGEHVPTHATVTIPDQRIVERPDFGLRMPFAGADPWLYRNRCNPRDTVSAGHNYSRLLPRDGYVDEHPEYFGPWNGRLSMQLCLTNPEVLNVAVNRIREVFDNNPDRRSYSLSPDDNPWFCECPDCRALDSGETMDVWTRPVPVVTDRVLWFSNRVCDEVLKTHPGRLFGLHIYHNYTPLPLRERPHPSLVLWVCHHTPACYAHTIDDPACPENVKFNDYLRGWCSMGNKIVVYAYVYKSVCDHLLWPMERIIAHDIGLMRDLGVWGFYGQGKAANAAVLGRHYWLCARLTWDADQDVDELLEDYYRNFYGEAYQPMKAYHQALMQSVADIGDHHVNRYPRKEGRAFLTREVMARCDRLLAEAEGMARDAKVRQRLEMVRAAWRHSDLYLQAAEAMVRHGQTGAEADLISAVTTYQALEANIAAHPDCFWLDQDGSLRGGWLPRYLQEAYGLYRASFGLEDLKIAELPTRWRFRLDPDQVGKNQGFEAPGFADDKWEQIEVGKTWEAQGYDYDGYAWYRCGFRLPAEAKGKPAMLAFGGVDGHCEVYVNGQLVGEHHDWATGFELPVAEQLNYGRQNVISVQVFDGSGLGGIYRPVILYSPADNVWIHGAKAIASGVPVEGEDAAQWSLSPGRHGATLRTQHREAATNPYNGAWIEYAFGVTTPGEYRIWLRLLNYQPEETRQLHLDGELIGELHGVAGQERVYLFRGLDEPVTLTEGQHVLRIVCTGIVGDLDPINYVYMTRDLALDPAAQLQEPDEPLMNRPDH